MSGHCAVHGSDSFIFLKPDGMRNAAVRSAVREWRETVPVRDVFERRLTRALVESLCWQNPINQLPIAARMISHYLVDEIAEITVVGGDESLAAVGAFKRQLRRSFSMGMFANVLHAPSSERECTWQLSLFYEPPDSAVYLNDPCNDFNTSTAARLCSLEPSILDQQVNEVWAHASRHGWAALADLTPALRNGASELVLCSGENSIDHIVSTLWDVIPEVSLAQAIALTFETDRLGRLCVWRGSAAEVHELVERLRAASLACVSQPSET